MKFRALNILMCCPRGNQFSPFTSSAFCVIDVKSGFATFSQFPTLWGRQVSTGIREAKAAGRGAAGLVKSGNKVIANNDYDYALAA